MRTIKLDPKIEESSGGKTAYVDKDGKLHCYCNAELVEEGPGVYRCATGAVRFHLDKREVELDKYGNVLLKDMGEH